MLTARVLTAQRLPPELRICIAGAVALAVAMGVGRFAFTPMLPLMRAEGLLSVVEAGSLASIHFFGYWLGSVSAHWKPLRSGDGLRISLLLIVAGTAAMGLAADYHLWFVLRLFTGVLSAWVFILVGHFYGNRLLAAHRPQLQSWVLAGVGIGICATGLLALVFMLAGLSSALGWCLLAAICLAVIVPVYKSPVPADATPAAAAPAAGSGDRQRWPLVLAYGSCGFGYSIPATFLPLMARDEIAKPLVFGWCWPVFGLAASVATLLAGRCHRLSDRRIWAGSQLLMGVGVLLPGLHPSIVPLTLAGVAVGATFLTITMVALRESRAVGGAGAYRLLALLTTAFASGQMLGPLSASLASDVLGGFGPVLVITSGLLCATALPLLRQPLERK